MFIMGGRPGRPAATLLLRTKWLFTHCACTKKWTTLRSGSSWQDKSMFSKKHAHKLYGNIQSIVRA